MTPLHRYVMIALVSLSLVWIGLQQWLQPATTPGLEWVFLALALNGVLLLVPIVFYRPSYGWFHPLVFGLFYAFLNHLRRLDIYRTGLQWHAALPGWSPEHLTGVLTYELLLQALGLGALYAGYFLSPRIGLPAVQFRTPPRLGTKVMATVMFSAGIFAAYMQTRGGIINHILSWGKGRNEVLAGAFYWQFFTQMGMIACLSWLTMDRRSTSNPLFWGCTLASLSMAFLSGGSRSSVIYFMIMGLMAWLLRERKIALTRIVAIALSGLLIMGALGNLRESTYSGKIDWNVFRSKPAATSTTDGSALSAGLSEVSTRSSVYAGVFPILALVPHQVDYIQGSSYMAVLTLPVPRGLWPAKPGLIAGMVGETFFNAPVGMPPGPIGEAYWNFGIPGVLGVFTLFGLFSRWLATAFASYTHQPAAIVLYVITLFLFPEPTGLAIIAWLMMLVPAIGFLVAIGAIRWQGRLG